MQKRRKRLSQAAVLAMNLFLYTLLLGTFILVMSQFNHHLRLYYRRITAIILVSFTVVYGSLSKSIGGYAVGHEKNMPIIFSLALRVLLTDAVAYIEFLFMSYHSESRASVLPVWDEILGLGVVFALQLVWIIVMVVLGNFIYFKINPPELCCLLTSSREALVQVMSKLQKYRLRYKIVTVADYRNRNVRRIIADHDAVMLYAVPANERVELVEYAYHLNRNIYYSSEIPDILTR